MTDLRWLVTKYVERVFVDGNMTHSVKKLQYFDPSTNKWTDVPEVIEVTAEK